MKKDEQWQTKHYTKLGVNPGAPEGQAFPAPIVLLVLKSCDTVHHKL